MSSGETVRGSITSTEMPSRASRSHSRERAMHHQRERDDGHVRAFAHDARLAELDLVRAPPAPGL